MTHILKRWWIYQQERFPLIKNGVFVAALAFSAVGYSVLLQTANLLQDVNRDRPSTYPLRIAVIAWVNLLLFWGQLQIVDEIKDVEDDRQYRANRPVPRGLVSVQDLRILAIALAALQLGLALSTSLSLLPLLLLIWGYLSLISKDFFASAWLKNRPVVYVISYTAIVPLLALYAMAHNWLVVNTAPPSGIITFLLLSWCGGAVLELGSKIRAPKDEALGVGTYTALWGRKRAVIAWLVALWLMTLVALLTAVQIQFVVPIVLCLLFLLTGSMTIAWRFLAHPITKWASAFELISILWMVIVYVGLGILPFYNR